jgi:hypothetical protein
MAGIFFTNGSIFLAGVKRETGLIIGIGGKKEGSELPYQTAVRETLEELFEFEFIPEELITMLCRILKFDNVIGSPNYTTFIMDISDIEVIIGSLTLFDLKSKVYKEIPSSFMQLILSRKITDSCEISKLLILPIECEFKIDSCLNEDIQLFKKINDNNR